MEIKKMDYCARLDLMLAAGFACHFSVSTALKLSKDKAASQETNTFAEGDTVYAVAVVSNGPGQSQSKGTAVNRRCSGRE
jgi:hypothetical protein